MRILIVSPGSLDVPGGNTISILRLQEGLRAAGHEVQTSEAGAVQASQFPPGSLDVVHGFHVRKGGVDALEVARSSGARLVVTLTGTETSLDWAQPRLREQVVQVLASGAGLIALRGSHLEELRRLSGLDLEDAAVIPQTIRLGNAPLDLRASLGLAADVPLVLLPGGLRPVKGQDWALDALDHPGADWHLVLMGPELDREFARGVLARVAEHGRAHSMGAAGPGAMGACYSACDLVLNTSETEGESNAILEAMAAARVVLARSNAGNRALIQDGINGIVFEDRDGLAWGVQLLLEDPALRTRLARSARAGVESRLDPAAEVRAHLDFYGAGGAV